MSCCKKKTDVAVELSIVSTTRLCTDSYELAPDLGVLNAVIGWPFAFCLARVHARRVWLSAADSPAGVSHRRRRRRLRVAIA
eukprot:2554202-Pleurochrysis_carterae.AAC.1